MLNYRIVSKKGEGTFSEVMRAVQTSTGRNFAIKCMKRPFDTIDEVNKLLEIQALRKLNGHPHIVQLREVLFEDHRLAMVFELMEMNVYEAIKDRRTYLPESRVVKWMFDLCQAIGFMHRNNFFHRDVKPENLLLIDDVLKLADLGSCSCVSSKQPFTEYISTRWYRAPECLLTSGFYSAKMDVWAAGCVFFELLTLNPLFPGKNELDQIHKIHSILGTPSDDLLAAFRVQGADHLRGVKFSSIRGSGFSMKLTHCSADAVAAIGEMITYDQAKRPSAAGALRLSVFARNRSESLSPVSTTSSESSRQFVPPLSIPKAGVPFKASSLHAHGNYNNPYWKRSPRSQSMLFPKLSNSNTARARFLSSHKANCLLASARHV